MDDSNPTHPVYEAQLQAFRQTLTNFPMLDAERVIAAARPAIGLIATRLEGRSFELGGSRIGGLPDVPAGFEWPRWLPSEDVIDTGSVTQVPTRPMPLGFVAQLDLSRLPRVDDTLPESGWLYFFYDIARQPWGQDQAHKDGFKVLYFDCPREELRPADRPADIEKEQLARPCILSATVMLTLPGYSPFDDWIKTLGEDLPPVGLLTMILFKLQGRKLPERIDDAYIRLLETIDSRRVRHQFTGHPWPIQGRVEVEFDSGDWAGALNGGGDDLKWRLLHQIDTDDHGPGWMWGDAGTIYFCMKHDDMIARRFDLTRLVLQCG